MEKKRVERLTWKDKFEGVKTRDEKIGRGEGTRMKKSEVEREG